MIPIARVQEHVDDLAGRLASIEVGYNALAAHVDPAAQPAFADLRTRIERAKLHAEGLAAALRETS